MEAVWREGGRGCARVSLAAGAGAVGCRNVLVMPERSAGSCLGVPGRKKQCLCVGREPAAPLDPPGAQLSPSPPCAWGTLSLGSRIKALLWGSPGTLGSCCSCSITSCRETGVDCQVPGSNLRTFSACLVTAASGDFEVQ